MAEPRTVISKSDLKTLCQDWQEAGETWSLVPTMGALHEGHLALVEAAKRKTDRVLVSIFVNPMQFGPNEDYERYPRTLKNDLALLTSAGVDGVFLPHTTTLYPEGFDTTVSHGSLGKELCGIKRPGHFDGVATVVIKLLHLANPKVAVFGKKDYQQWRLMERIVTDLSLEVEIVGIETNRDQDGLAKSSRNSYLSPTERQAALKIFEGMSTVKALFEQGERVVEKLTASFDEVVAAAPMVKVEYRELRAQTDLERFGESIPAGIAPVILVAAQVGSTRLIDNLELVDQSV